MHSWRNPCTPRAHLLTMAWHSIRFRSLQSVYIGLCSSFHAFITWPTRYFSSKNFFRPFGPTVHCVFPCRWGSATQTEQ